MELRQHLDSCNRFVTRTFIVQKYLSYKNNNYFKTFHCNEYEGVDCQYYFILFQKIKFFFF